jgi:hypothetical protein
LRELGSGQLLVTKRAYPNPCVSINYGRLFTGAGESSTDSGNYSTERSSS